MLFANAEDDDFSDVKPSKHLSSLFGGQENASSSLHYTPPKQPTLANISNNGNAVQSGSLLSYRTVEVHEILDSQLHSRGKCGLAVIGNHAIKSYEIVLYRTKQDIVTRLKIGVNFEVKLVEGNFAKFSDGQGSRWRIKFERYEQLCAFVNEITKFGAKITKLQEQSETESDSSISHTKVNILNRLAKMGQQILPATTMAQRSELSGDDDDSESDHLKNKRVSHKSKCTHSSVPIKEVSALSLATPHSVVTSDASFSYSIPDQMHAFIAENRTHNCEIRMNVSEVSRKLDRILEAGSLEARLQALEKQLSGKQAGMSSLEELKEQNEALAAKLLCLEQSISHLEDENNVLRAENKLLKLELEHSKGAAAEAEKEINCLKESEEKDRGDKENELLKLELEDSKRAFAEATIEINRLKESEQKARVDKETFSNFLKVCMSHLYIDVIGDLADSSTKSQVELVLAKKIRKATYQLIEQSFK